MHEQREANILPERYQCGYDSLRRFVSYWHQIDEIQRVQPDRVLEIGVGNGFVSNYLRERGSEVVTLDVNPALEADVVGTITSMSFRQGSFDVVSACDVLEHLPREFVIDALREMRRVTRTAAVVSVQNRRRAYPIQLYIPRIGVRRWLLERSSPPGLPLYRNHDWEIGHGGVAAGDVREWIAQAGFDLERDWRPFHNPKHHFFILRAR